MKTTTTKVTTTTKYVTNLIAKVEMTYVPDHCVATRTIKAGEIVAKHEGAYWYEAWDFEGNPAENFRVEHLAVTRTITTEIVTEVVE